MSTAQAILAIDQGTTSSRAMLFDRRGQPMASAQHEFLQHFPQPGWVEHDPEDIWRDTLHVTREAMAKSGLAASDVAAIVNGVNGDSVSFFTFTVVTHSV